MTTTKPKLVKYEWLYIENITVYDFYECMWAHMNICTCFTVCPEYIAWRNNLCHESLVRQSVLL